MKTSVESVVTTQWCSPKPINTVQNLKSHLKVRVHSHSSRSCSQPRITLTYTGHNTVSPHTPSPCHPTHLHYTLSPPQTLPHIFPYTRRLYAHTRPTPRLFFAHTRNFPSHLSPGSQTPFEANAISSFPAYTHPFPASTLLTHKRPSPCRLPPSLLIHALPASL